ncbi:MAG: hypothetical protein II085_00010 [Alphaproteobacteria bacterium]|nr:hypothetical protein [Alphaproteobacteria bacterium]
MTIRFNGDPTQDSIVGKQGTGGQTLRKLEHNHIDIDAIREAVKKLSESANKQQPVYGESMKYVGPNGNFLLDLDKVRSGEMTLQMFLEKHGKEINQIEK